MRPEDHRIVQLLQSALAGDREDGMRLLLLAHAGAVSAALARHVARAADRDDLLQEVWLKVYRARHRIDLDAPEFRPWLFRIARNVLLDHVRKRRPPEGQAIEPAARPDPGVERRDELDALRRHFQGERESLSPKQRRCVEELLEGRFEPGMLAGEHGCTRESVHMELLRGLRKLGWR